MIGSGEFSQLRLHYICILKAADQLHHLFLSSVLVFEMNHSFIESVFNIR